MYCFKKASMNKIIKNFDYLDKKKTFSLLFIFSCFYSLLINPHAQEAVTYGYIANINTDVKYFENWFHTVRNQPFSLQVIIPFTLLKIGINKIILHYLWQILTALISFSAIFYFSKLITKSNFFSFITAIILINHKFINTNLYGLYYPTHNYYFGQMGMYLLLLSITSIYNERYKLSLVFFFTNILMHAGWAAPNFFLIIILSFKYQLLKNFKNISTLIIFIVFIVITISSYFYAKKNNFYNSPNKIEKVDKDKKIEKVDKEKKKIISKDKKYTEGHKINFLNYDTINKKVFFIIKLLFYDLLLLLTWFILKKYNYSELRFITPFIVLTLSIYFFIFFQNEILSILSTINIRLANIIDRILINRFLNINNLVFIVFTISIFWKLYSQNKDNNDLFIITILMSIFLFLFKDKNMFGLVPYGKYINYFNLIIWFACVYSLFKIFLKSYSQVKTLRIQRYNTYNFALLLLCLSSIIFLINISIKNINEKNARIALFNLIEQDKSLPIILSGNVYGRLDTLYYSDYTYIFPDWGNKKFVNKKKNVDLYCLNSNDQFLNQLDWYNFLNQDCFPNKDKREWQEINRLFSLNYVIVPNSVQLSLTQVKTTNDFSLYKIK